VSIILINIFFTPDYPFSGIGMACC